MSSSNNNPKNHQITNSTLYNDCHKQYSSSSTLLPTTAYYARIILILSFLWLVVWGWQLRYELLCLQETNRTMKTVTTTSTTTIPNDNNELFYNDNYDDESSNYLRWIPQFIFPNNNDNSSQQEEEGEQQEEQQQEPNENKSQQSRLQNSVRGKSFPTKRMTTM
jgi:hypothetical protein